jgi:hypothetical protein
MNKFISLLLLIMIPMLICSCGKKSNMDVKQLDGKYHYENRDLGFQIDLPAEFEYFQTQRQKGDGYIDLEFFVPTSDTFISQEVKGYGKPFLVRVYEKNVWEKYDSSTEKKDLIKIGESNRVYAIKFWNQIPKDWKQRWTSEYEKSLTNMIKIY